MKDLVLHDVKCYLYPIGIRFQQKAKATTFDGLTFVIIGDGDKKTLYKLIGEDSKQVLQIDTSQELICPIYNLLHEPKILMVTGDEVIFYDYKTTDAVKYDFNKKILAANVSVQNSCIAVVTKTEVILYFIGATLGRLDCIASSPHNTKPEMSIYMGWDSRENIFDGPNPACEVPVAYYYESDDRKPQVSWSADGTVFAVNMHDNRNRVIKIFDNTCKLLYITDFRGLETLMEFRPITNMMTIIRSTNGSNQILTVIANGVIRVSLKLEDVIKVVSMKWSLCGKALAVECLFDPEDEPDIVCLDIYMETYSRWVRKQRLQFDSYKWCGFEWVSSLENIFKLRVFTNDGIFVYQFVGKIVKCVHPYASYGVSATTLGRRAQFQFFVDGIYGAYEYLSSTYTIKMKNQISYMAFDPYNYVVAIIDCNYNVKLYNYENIMDWDLLGEFTMQNFNHLIPLCYRTILIENTYDILALKYSFDPKYMDVLYRYRLKNYCLRNIGHENIMEGIFVLNYTINGKFTGDLFFFNYEDVALPIDAFAYRTAKQLIKVTLKSNGQLSLNRARVKAFVTSMFYDCENLILTVSTEDRGDYLIAIKLNDMNLKRLMDKEDPFTFAYNRSIVQGAVCINRIHNSASMLLLKPSGIDYAVEVRSITIKKLCELIQQFEYELAFKLLNFYGMGLNMLVDVNPQQFLEKASLVYAELKDFDIFPEIVLGLRESSHQYKDGGHVYNFPDVKNKIEKVCEALLTCCCQEILINMNARAVALLSLFSTYPTLNLPAAICFLSSYAYGTDISCAEDTIDALSEYVSYEDMFASALFVCNLGLAELIVNMSKLDSNHYTTFLQSLHLLKEYNTQRVLISKFLKEYKLATVYLCEIYQNSPEEVSDKAKEDLLTYAKENGTLKIAHQTLNANDKCMDELTVLWGHDLNNNQHYLESGMVFYRHRNFEEAYGAFSKGHHFDEALASIQGMDATPEKRCVQVNGLIDIMLKADEYEKAAHAYLTHLDDIDGAVMYFLKARQYMTAYNLALMMPAVKSVISINVIPSMLEYCDKISLRLVDNKKSFESYYDRLIQILTERYNKECDKNCIVLRDPQESFPSNVEPLTTPVPTNAALLSTNAALLPPNAALLPTNAALRPRNAALLPTNAALLPTNAALLPANAALLPTNAALLPTNAALLPTNTALLPTNAALLPRNATLLPTNAALLPTNAALLPTNAALLPTNAALLPTNAALLPTNAALLPTNAALLPTNAALLPTNAALLPTNAALLPTNAALLPTNAALLPTNEATVPTNEEPLQSNEEVMNVDADSVPSLQVGGAYEDIAIIVKLYEMTVEVFSMQEELKQLFTAFYFVMPNKRNDYLKQIHRHLLDYEKFIIRHAGSIWRKEYTDITAVAAALVVCPDLHLLDPKYRSAPPNMKIIWESNIAGETPDDELF